MSEITNFRLTDVRCFEGTQSARMARVTLLVGENSTGKSTFLGCYKVFAQLSNFADLENRNYFDDEPFRMGKFDTIVRSGKSEFSIDADLSGHKYERVRFVFRAGPDGEPDERKVRIEFDGPDGNKNHFEISRPAGPADIWRLEGRNLRFDLDGAEVSYVPISHWLSNNVRRGFLPFQGEPMHFRKRAGPEASPEQQAEFAKLITFLRTALPIPDKPPIAVEALEPTLPPRRRIHDSPPLGEEDNAGLERYLAKAGEELDLFSSLETRKRADSLFELMIETFGSKRNIIDVGYGVHGALWLLKAMYGKPKNTVFLLQQPEVHLHPAAQASLAQLMVDSDYRFMIETHSDHIIDRLCICVMKKNLKPTNLSIVYFEPNKDKNKSRIHSISVDESGNLVNVPPSYRKFFLDEAEKRLGFR